MAALGKIRSKGTILVLIIALGLFAFIAEEAFRSCNGIKGQQSQQIGEVLGEKINYQDFQKLVDEYQDVVKFTMQRDNLNEDELNQLKDQVWQQYIANTVMEADAKKLGLTVTDEEIENILAQGTNPMLMQTPFVKQETKRFDVNSLKQFVDEYNKANSSNNPQMQQQAEQMRPIYNYWLFIEKNLRSQLLAQKYQGLLANCVLSNKVEAKMAFKDENEESQIKLASLAYSTIKDSEIKVEDSDLKAKYDELKAGFKQAVESRDVKYVDVQILASAADRNAIAKEMADFQKQLAVAEEPAQVVSKSASQVPFIDLPKSKNAYPSDIAERLDSIGIGTTGVTENKADNTLNIIRLISKTSLPDSVEYRQIQVGAASVAEARTKADSIYKALQGGADFEVLAKKYGQTGQKVWLTNNQYEGANTMSVDNRQYIESLLNGTVGETKNLELSQGNVILQVLDRRAMADKYNAAVIKKVIDFRKDTRAAAYNKFSEYVTKCTSVEELEKNAKKYGYKVQEQTGLTTSQHTVANVRGTREALKWIFSAKEGEISPLYECGDNDHMMVVALTKVRPQGYADYKDLNVADVLKREVINDKKAEKLMAKLQGVNNVNAAKAKGAKISDVNQITFASPAFIPEIGAMEPAISGAVAATAAGKFSKNAVKGNSGVYLFQVVKKTMRAGVKYNEKTQEQRCRQSSLQYVGNFMQDLISKAGVVDNRYLFF